MIVLGIDPGSIKSGYALVEVMGKKITYLQSGVMKFDQKLDLIERTGQFYQGASKLIEAFSPDEIALETLIYVKSIPSLAKLSQARGAMLAAFAGEYQGKMFEYTPNQIKAAVTGHGHADKEMIGKTLKMIFKGQLNKEFETHDESDALAIALTHGLLACHMKGQRETKNDRILKGRSSL